MLYVKYYISSYSVTGNVFVDPQRMRVAKTENVLMIQISVAIHMSLKDYLGFKRNSTLDVPNINTKKLILTFIISLATHIIRCKNSWLNPFNTETVLLVGYWGPINDTLLYTQLSKKKTIWAHFICLMGLSVD